MSPSRTAPAIARATRRSTASPTAWPCSLFTAENRSRSRTMRLSCGRRPARRGEGGLDRLVEEASVEQAGQLVADGGLAHPGVPLGVLQRDCDLGREQVGDAQLELAERRGAGPVARRPRTARDLALDADRQGQPTRAAVDPGLTTRLRGGTTWPPRRLVGSRWPRRPTGRLAGPVLDAERPVGAATRRFDRVRRKQVARRRPRRTRPSGRGRGR